MVYGISYCPISMKETLEQKAFAGKLNLLDLYGQAPGMYGDMLPR